MVWWIPRDLQASDGLVDTEGPAGERLDEEGWRRLGLGMGVPHPITLYQPRPRGQAHDQGEGAGSEMPIYTG